jgi:putative ABC transport system ATP-binding protein
MTESNERGPDVLVAESLACAFPSGRSGMAPVRDASLRVARGEVVAVLGPSGSGKSTLLTLCGGLDRPDRGRVLVNGLDVAAMEETDRDSFLRRVVGWVFQSTGLVPLLTAEENVALAMQIAGAPPGEVARITQMALDAVGLTERANHRTDQLSRGEHRRVALARALVKAPMLLIADEPTAHLDARTADDILVLLHDASRSDIAVLFTSHDEAQVGQADRVLVMDEGVLLEATHRHPAAAGGWKT